LFQELLRFYGVSSDDLSANGGRVFLAGYDDLIAAFAAGMIDAVFGATTMPAPSIARAGSGSRACRLAPLPQAAADYFVNRFGCRPGVIPADTYPELQSADVATCFAETVIVVGAEVDDETVEGATRRILELDHRREIHPCLAGFNPYTAWRNVPTPMHPAAARAYRDLGYLG
jgi:hypothetical protein